MKEVKSQMKVGVAIEVLSRNYAKEISFILPKLAPNLVRSVEVIEGDGGLGTVYLIDLGSGEFQLPTSVGHFNQYFLPCAIFFSFIQY